MKQNEVIVFKDGFYITEDGTQIPEGEMIEIAQTFELDDNNSQLI